MTTDSQKREDAGMLEDFKQRIEELERRLVLTPSLPAVPAFLPVGFEAPFPGLTAPTGWLIEDGTAVSRTTYASLYTLLNQQVGTATVTIASPGVWTRTAHGMFTGQRVYITTTGALPTGLTANSVSYYVINVTANTFRLATTLANAIAGTAINTSGSQSGTHTIWRTFGAGDGSTTFNVPDSRGQTLVGLDTTQAEFASMGRTGGAKTHALTSAENGPHTHPPGTFAANYWGYDDTGDPQFMGGGEFGVAAPTTTGSSGSGTPHNNLQPYGVRNWIIKALPD